MKIIIIGATGTIGSAVVKAMSGQHQIIQVGLTNGDYTMDISNEQSIISTLNAIKADHGEVDALISTTGKVKFAEFANLSTEDWHFGFNNKAMGQINLVRHAKDYLVNGGSITLTTGILSDEHILKGVSAAAVNGAIHSFVTGVAPVLSNNLRINCVSPTMLEESAPVYGDFFPGFVPVPAKKVAQYYVRSVMGIGTGQIFKVN